jgi:LAO/AO transport system kinase
MKAGLMEIGDLFVINKADREGAERAAYAINTALEMRAPQGGWQPPVVMTVASQGSGVDEVVGRFEEHLIHLQGHAGLERRRRVRLERHLEDLMRSRLWEGFRAGLPEARWLAVVESLARRELTPHRAAARLAGEAGTN